MAARGYRFLKDPSITSSEEEEDYVAPLNASLSSFTLGSLRPTGRAAPTEPRTGRSPPSAGARREAQREVSLTKKWLEARKYGSSSFQLFRFNKQK
jgi:hypothetical protein